MTEREEVEKQRNPEISKDKPKQHKIDIFYANINGLSEKKINQSDMLKDIDRADLICLTETHLREENELPNIDGYRAFHTIVNRKNYLGRNIKGVSIYCKENMNLSLIHI